MSRLGFQNAAAKPAHFLALTGLAVEEFNALKPFFEKAFLHHVKMYTISGREREVIEYLQIMKMHLSQQLKINYFSSWFSLNKI